MARLVREYIEYSKSRGDNMLFKLNDTNKIVDLTDDELFALSEDQLMSITPYNDSKKATDAYVAALDQYVDCWRMSPYYASNDKINDPDGWLHEDYCCINSWEPLNESNLLKYNHKNVKVYNELLDQKYKELGGVQHVTDRYVIEKWPQIGPAVNSVAYGYDQSIVYKNLCDAFGKENTDRIWRKYYKFQQDDGLTEN